MLRVGQRVKCVMAAGVPFDEETVYIVSCVAFEAGELFVGINKDPAAVWSAHRFIPFTIGDRYAL